MTVETCTYHTVTLQAGEQFNLPPGATLIAVSDPGAITSTNDCANTDNLEAFACYGFVVPCGESSSPDDATFDSEKVKWFGIEVNNIYYPFSSPLSHVSPFSGTLTTDVANLQTAIKDGMLATPLGGLFINFVIDGSKYDLYDNAIATYMIFQTTPTIASTLRLVGGTAIGLTGSGTGYGEAEFLMPCYTRDEIITGTPIPGTGTPNIQDCFSV